MNKAEVIRQVSKISGIEADDCTQVIEALEEVLSRELSYSDGKRKAFDKIYGMLTFIKNRK